MICVFHSLNILIYGTNTMPIHRLLLLWRKWLNNYKTSDSGWSLWGYGNRQTLGSRLLARYSPPGHSGSGAVRVSLTGPYAGSWCCIGNKHILHLERQLRGCWGQENRQVMWAATSHRHHFRGAVGTGEMTPHAP